MNLSRGGGLHSQLVGHYRGQFQRNTPSVNAWCYGWFLPGNSRDGQIQRNSTFRCSRLTAGVPSSHLGHSVKVSSWTKRRPGRIFLGFHSFSPAINFSPPFIQAHLINLVSSVPNGATGVVGRQPYDSQIFKKGASSQLIPRPGPAPNATWYLFILWILC